MQITLYFKFLPIITNSTQNVISKWYEWQSCFELAHRYYNEVSQVVIPKTFKGVEGENPTTHKSCTKCMRVYTYTKLLQEQALRYSKDKCKVYSTYTTINQDVREVSKFVLLTYGNSFIVTIHCSRLAQLEKF